MTTRRTFIMTLIALLLLPAGLVRAADDGKGDKSAELKKRFQERAGDVHEAKSKGVVGETDAGYLEWVEKKDSKYADVVKAENDDRKELYALLAKKTHESEETVAKHAAQRNFDRAKPGEYLQYEGKWRKKEG